MELSSHLEILLNEDSTEKILEAYTGILASIKEELIDHDKFKTCASDLLECMCRDMKGREKEIAASSLNVLSEIVNNFDILEDVDQQNIQTLLSSSLLSSAEAKPIKDYFHTVSQNCESEGGLRYQNFLKISHDVIFKDAKTQISDSVSLGILGFIEHMSKSTQIDSEESHLMCLKIVLSLMAENEKIVRSAALKTAESFLANVDVGASLVPSVAAYLKQHVVPKIKALYTKETILLKEVLTQQWPLILRIMGVSIKKSSSLMNALLAIVEQGFRHTRIELKKASFKAWNCLINCYAEDLEVLSSARYMKLLMQPLMATQNSDELDMLKIEILWNLACKLKSKLPNLFTTVCLPMLHSCLGNLDPERLSRRSGDKLTTPLKARHSGVGVSSSAGNDVFYAALQASGYKATPRKASRNINIQTLGVEILVHLLDGPAVPEVPDSVKDTFRLAPLEHPLLSTTATFVSHGSLFVTAVSEALCHLDGHLSDGLVLSLWNRLAHHVNSHLETSLKRKKRETELFNLCLMTLQNVISSEAVSSKLRFMLIKSFLDFPRGILSSTFYGGNSNGMHGVPALCLLRLLFDKHLMKDLSSAVNMSVAEVSLCANDLIMCGLENKMRVLSFCQAVLEILQGSVELLAPENPHSSSLNDLLLTVWVRLGAPLNEHVVKSQEVNQGDNFEHDFAAMYSFLLFPCLLTPKNVDCFGTWEKVYKSFLWCSSLVTTSKTNEICKHIATEIVKKFDRSWNDSKFSFLVNVVSCMLSKAELNHKGFPKPSRLSYHEMSAPPEFSHDLVSLEVHKNLRELFALLKLLLNHSKSFDEDFEKTGELMRLLCFAFTSIHSAYDALHLFHYFVPVLENVIKSEKRKDMRDHFQGILGATGKALVENRMSQEELLDFFKGDELLSMILHGLQQNDRQIKQSVIEFWQEVVVGSEHHADVCDTLSDNLKENLLPLYERLGWVCPWRAAETSESQEVIVRQQTQDGTFTQSSLPPIPAYGAFGSPLKKRSFLSPKKSPLHPVRSPAKTPTSAAKKDLHSLSENVTFVKCSSPFPKPRTPLTEHQKEKMREREYIPTLYNDLDERSEESSNETQDTQEETGPPSAYQVTGVAQNITEGKENNEEQANIIKTSQPTTETKTTPKSRMTKSNTIKGKRKISLKNMIAIREVKEDSGTDDSTSDQNAEILRRSGRIRSQRLSKGQPAAAKRSSPHKVNNNVLSKKTKCEESEDSENENAIESSISTSSDKDSLTGAKACESPDKDDHTDDEDMASEEDVSYEYVELADASTNQTKNDLSIDESTDDVMDTKDLGVTPLDDSYEYVAVADMSMNVTSNMSAIAKVDVPDPSDQETDTSVAEHSDTHPASPHENSTNDTGDESEYEEVAMADMSTYAQGNANTTYDLDASNHEEEVETNRKPGGDAADLADMDSDVKPLDQEMVAQGDSEGCERGKTIEIDLAGYISSDGDDSAFQDEVEDDNKTLNETEYEYVEVADMSAVAGGNNTTTISGEDDEENKVEFQDCKQDASIYIVSDDDPVTTETACETGDELDATDASLANDSFEETDADETADEFTDARSSLGTLHGESEDERGDSRPEEEMNMSGDSSTSGDLFDASVETDEIAKSLVNETIVTDNSYAEDDVQGGKNTPQKENAPMNETDVQGGNDIAEQHEVSIDRTDNLPAIVETDEDCHASGEESHPAPAASKPSSPEAKNAIMIENTTSPPESCFKLPAVNRLQGESESPPIQSPGGRGILKRKVVAQVVASPANRRRVSFAEPISKSKRLENVAGGIIQSPRSSLLHRKKHSPRGVSRRLSLPAEMKCVSADSIPVSPLSLRSARVAEAIANIRAKDPACPESPSRLSLNFLSRQHHNVSSSSASGANPTDLSKIILKDLGDPEFIKQLKQSELKDILHFHIKTTATLYEALMKNVEVKTDD